MFSLAKTNHRAILGVDITPTAVKVVEISSAAGKHCIEGYGCMTLPEAVMEGTIIKDLDQVAHCIKTILRKARITCRQAALAVADAATISKIIQINKAFCEKEIEALVLVEAGKFIPYPLAEINLDFTILGISSQNSDWVDVLIVASKAENVNNRVEVINRAGLEAKIIDVTSYAVARAAQLIISSLLVSSKIIAIIDIGDIYTHFYILYNKKIIFTHEEKFGSTQLIEAIMQYFKIDAQAARAALQFNTLPEEYEKTILQPFKESLLLQVKRGLQFFLSTSQYPAVDNILLAGNVAQQINAAEILQMHTNITTSVAHCVQHLTLAKTVDKEQLFNDSPDLLVACGLALRA